MYCPCSAIAKNKVSVWYDDLYLTSSIAIYRTMSGRGGRKRGFGFGGFALKSSFHKSGELGSWQQERKDEGWSAKKHRSEEE